MWNPDPRLTYYGPYPYRELFGARAKLINQLNKGSAIIERLKPKIGIPSAYGAAIPEKPIEYPPTRELAQSVPKLLGRTKLDNSSIHHKNFQQRNSVASSPQLGVTRDGKKSTASHTIVRPLIEDSSVNVTEGNQIKSNYKSKDSDQNVIDLTESPKKEEQPGKGLKRKLTSAEVEPLLVSTDDEVKRIRRQSLNSSSSSSQEDLTGEKSKTFWTSRPGKPILPIDANLSSKAVPDNGGKHSTNDVQNESDADNLGDQIPPSTSFHLGESSGDIISETLLDICKCDFCPFYNEGVDLGGVRQHLFNANHFSASIYKVRKDSNDQIELVYVEKSLAIRNSKAKDEALAVMCPQCHMLFENTFMCGYHFKQHHGNFRALYAICPVIFNTTVPVTSMTECGFCHRFGCNLSKHWRQFPSHHPVQRELPDNAIAIYSCTNCYKMFVDNFMDCWNHIVCHKEHANFERIMKVKYILKPMRSDELPPSKHEVVGGVPLEEEIALLKQTNKHMKKFGGYKKEKSTD